MVLYFPCFAHVFCDLQRQDVYLFGPLSPVSPNCLAQTQMPQTVTCLVLACVSTSVTLPLMAQPLVVSNQQDIMTRHCALQTALLSKVMPQLDTKLPGRKSAVTAAHTHASQASRPSQWHRVPCLERGRSPCLGCQVLSSPCTLKPECPG